MSSYETVDLLLDLVCLLRVFHSHGYVVEETESTGYLLLSMMTRRSDYSESISAL